MTTTTTTWNVYFAIPARSLRLSAIPVQAVTPAEALARLKAVIHADREWVEQPGGDEYTLSAYPPDHHDGDLPALVVTVGIAQQPSE